MLRRVLARSTLALLAATIVQWPTWTQAAPSVVIWPTDGRSDVRALESIAKSRGFEVVPFERLREPLSAARRRAVAHEARVVDTVAAALREAQRAYLDQRWAEMADALRSIDTDALAVIGKPRACATLWEIEFLRGLAALRPDDDDEVRRRYAMALALDPTSRPPRAYGPEAVGRFADVEHAISSEVARPVVLSIEPAGARVWVDCRPLDRDATTVSVRPGLHAVVVQAPGFADFADVVELRGEFTVTLAKHPHDPTALAEALPHPIDLRSTPEAEAVGLLARSLGAQAAVLVELGSPAAARGLGDRVHPVVFDPRPGGAVRAALTDLVPEPPRLTGSSPVRPDDRKSRTTPLVRSWWLWTIVGVVAATALGLGLGLGLGLQKSEPRLVIEVSDG